MPIKNDEQVQSMQERAYGTILKRMLSGELPAGTPLSESSLAREWESVARRCERRFAGWLRRASCARLQTGQQRRGIFEARHRGIV